MDLVQSLNHNFDHDFYHKIDHNCGLGVQGKLSRRTWHYPRCAGEAIAAYLALSNEEGREEGRREGGGRQGGRQGGRGERREIQLSKRSSALKLTKKGSFLVQFL